MNPRSPHARLRQLLAVVTAGLVVLAAFAAGSANAAEPQPFKGKRNIVVETRNLFVGTDLDPIFRATSFPQLVAATTVAFGNVQATNFPERAQALAAEIAEENPDIVGLQEAVIIRTDTPADGPASPAEVVLYDYLDILLEALETQGAHYVPLAVVTNADNELPTALGFDVRVTDRDVILARAKFVDAGLVSNPQSGRYATNLSVSTVVGPITLYRGWTAIDVTTRGRTFRVVNTHLETSVAPPIQAAQAQELLAGPANTSLPVILVGDFNSRVGTPAYQALAAGGFSDAWSVLRDSEPGLTCCWETHLLDAEPPFDERIDLVLFRGRLVPRKIEILGEDPLVDRTPSGLFHSDHAGVVARLRVPR